MNPMQLAALAAGAYLLLKPKTHAVAPVPVAPSPRPPAPVPAPSPRPPVVTPGPPLPLPKPTAIPWPAATPPPVVPAQQGISQTAPAVITTSTAVPQNEEAAVISREHNPDENSYWMPVARPTAQEVRVANELLAQWKPGAISFNGPRTFAGRRMFRASKGPQRGVTVWQPRPPFVHQVPAATPPGITLRQGSRGPRVAALQAKLGVASDGIYGPKTANAVLAYQRAHGLKADGIAGPQTLASLGL